MKISIVTMGSRGDVQPYLGLALGLREAGFHPTFLGPPNFKDWVEGHGVPFVSVGPDYAELFASDVVLRWMEGDIGALYRAWREFLDPVLEGVLESSKLAADYGDAILYDAKVFGVADVAEATGKKAICISFAPMTTPTPNYPFPATPLLQMLAARSRGPNLNRATHIVGRMFRCFYLPKVNAWRRRELGLGPGPMFPPVARVAGRDAPRLHLLSRHIAPPADEHNPLLCTTGYPFLDEDENWRPDPALQSFLDAGPPPIYIGFGSMRLRDPERLTRTITEAIRLAGVRAIFGKGWGGLSDSEDRDDIFQIGYAPHQKLFPLTAATIHHGGSGTTAVSLRAGKPSLVLAFSFDQPWWGERLHDLGVGPRPIWARKAKAAPLAKMIRQLVDREDYQRNAQAVAAKMAQEDGVREGVAAVKRFLGV